MCKKASVETADHGEPTLIYMDLLRKIKKEEKVKTPPVNATGPAVPDKLFEDFGDLPVVFLESEPDIIEALEDFDFPEFSSAKQLPDLDAMSEQAVYYFGGYIQRSHYLRKVTCGSCLNVLVLSEDVLEFLKSDASKYTEAKDLGGLRYITLSLFVALCEMEKVFREKIDEVFMDHPRQKTLEEISCRPIKKNFFCSLANFTCKTCNWSIIFDEITKV